MERPFNTGFCYQLINYNKEIIQEDCTLQWSQVSFLAEFGASDSCLVNRLQSPSRQYLRHVGDIPHEEKPRRFFLNLKYDELYLMTIPLKHKDDKTQSLHFYVIEY